MKNKKPVKKKMPWESDDESDGDDADGQAGEWWLRPSVIYATVSSAIKTSTPSASPQSMPKNNAQCSTPVSRKTHPTTALNMPNERRRIRIKETVNKRDGITANTHRSSSRSSNADVSNEFQPIRNHLTADGEAGEGYINPLIECSFNYPRVCAQLERLMGTNVVRLTDRKYMTDLRRRIQEDFKELQDKRIGTREAQEMERQRNLLMQEGAVQCPPEYDLHPVFITNQETNKTVSYARSKKKTITERKAEMLVKKGMKWEAEKFKYAEIDRLESAALKERQAKAKQEEADYAESNKKRGTDLLRIKNRDYHECEFEMKWFLDAERDRMLKKKPKKHPLNPSKSDIFKICIAPVVSKVVAVALRDSNVGDRNEPEPEYGSLCAFESNMGNTEAFGESIDEQRQIKLLEKQCADALAQGYMMEKADIEQLHYEDPRVTDLKQTDTVKEMYEMADQIIYGLYDQKNRKPSVEAVEEDENKSASAVASDDAVEEAVDEAEAPKEA